jgi:hypothetical protein
MSTGITDEQARALGDLIAELNAASEVTLGKRLVPGRMEGYHADLHHRRIELPSHIQYPSERGGRRRKKRMSGGGICEDNIYISLAIDSAIILANAAILAGTGYAGYAALQFFMTTYAVPPAVIAVIKALYDALVATGSTLLATGLAVSSAASTVAGPASTLASTVASGIASSSLPVLSVFAKIAPGIAIGRYIGTDKNAYDDARSIINTLDSKYQSVRTYSTRLSTSIAEKKEATQQLIARTGASLTATYNQFSSGANATVEGSKCLYRNIKRKICEMLDSIGSSFSAATDIFPGLNDAMSTIDIEDSSCTISSGGKSKKRSIKTKRTKSKKRKITSRRRNRHRR